MKNRIRGAIFLFAIVVVLLTVIDLRFSASALATPQPALSSDRSQLEMPDLLVFGKDRPRVVIMGMAQHFAPESWIEVERRLRAELIQLDIEAVDLPTRAEDTTARIAELGAQAALQHAIAAIRIVRTTGKERVEVWIHDALTGKMVMRQLPIRDEVSGNASETALEVIELLEASLIEIRMRRKRKEFAHKVPKSIAAIVDRQMPNAANKPDRAPKPPKTIKPPTKRQIAPQLSVGPALIFTPGGIAPIPMLTVGLAIHPLARVRAEVNALVPLVRQTLKSRDRDADLLTFIVRSRALFSPWRGRYITPEVGIGIGLMTTRSQGQRAAATTPIRSDWGLSALLSLHLGLKISLSNSFSIGLLSGLSFALPEVEVEISDTDSRHAGLPLIDLALAAKWTF